MTPQSQCLCIPGCSVNGECPLHGDAAQRAHPWVWPQIAQQDPELMPWLFGIANNKPTRAGDFLKAIADAALRADSENYPLLRPALLELRNKYPQYSDPDAHLGGVE